MNVLLLVLSLAISFASASELHVSYFAILQCKYTLFILLIPFKHRRILLQESRNLRALTCTYVCPVYSVPKPNRSCYNTFDDCKCIDAYFKKYGKCIPVPSPTKRPTRAPYLKYTKAPIKAPTKKPTKAPTKKPTKAPTKKPTKAPTKKPTKAPTKKPTKAPIKYPTIYPTYAPNKYPICDFVCPVNSRPKEGVNCPKYFDDCKCDDGYDDSYENGKCIKEDNFYPTKVPVQACMYVCPINSRPKAGVKCPKNFDDCMCKDGYDDSYGKDECIKEDNIFPTKGPAKMCTYICPSNSYPKDNNPCPKEFDDCKCEDGYEDSKEKGECIKENNVYPTKSPLKKTCSYICPLNSRPKDSRRCPEDFDDCKCKDGYDEAKEEEECVKDD